MKRLMFVVVAFAACAVLGQGLSLSEARSKIGDAIADPTVMASTAQKLSADDQVKFLADVNEAIAKMPGSAETKAAAYLDANRAALKSAAKGNLPALLAEVFATVPPEALTVLNENLAADSFNRSANPSVTYTDEQYVDLAKKTLEVIAKRNADVDDGAVRTGFAILMFTRASNGSPAGLADTLAAVLPEASQDVAKKEWFPAALAEGEDKSYDPMLGDTDAPLPNEQVVMRIAHARSLATLLDDLAAGDIKNTANLNALRGSLGTDRGGIGSDLDNGLYRVPFYYNRGVFGTQAGQKGSDRPIGGGSVAPGLPGGVPVVIGKVPVVPGGAPVEPVVVPVGPGGVPVGPVIPVEPHGYQGQD